MVTQTLIKSYPSTSQSSAGLVTLPMAPRIFFRHVSSSEMDWYFMNLHPKCNHIKIHISWIRILVSFVKPWGVCQNSMVLSIGFFFYLNFDNESEQHHMISFLLDLIAVSRPPERGGRFFNGINVECTLCQELCCNNKVTASSFVKRRSNPSRSKSAKQLHEFLRSSIYKKKKVS